MLRAALALALTLATAANAAQHFGKPVELEPQLDVAPALEAKNSRHGISENFDGGTEARAPSTPDCDCEIFVVARGLAVVRLEDSFSLYAFAGFDPINRRDPFGLQSPQLPIQTPGPWLPPGAPPPSTTPSPWTWTPPAGPSPVPPTGLGLGGAIGLGVGIVIVGGGVAALGFMLTKEPSEPGAGTERQPFEPEPAKPNAPGIGSPSGGTPEATPTPNPVTPSAPVQAGGSRTTWPKTPRPTLEYDSESEIEKIHGEIPHELPKDPGELNDYLEELDISINNRKEEIIQRGETPRTPQHRRRLEEERLKRRQIEEKIKRTSGCHGSTCGFTQ